MVELRLCLFRRSFSVVKQVAVPLHEFIQPSFRTFHVDVVFTDENSSDLGDPSSVRFFVLVFPVMLYFIEYMVF